MTPATPVVAHGTAIDLVLATTGRTAEPRRFLDSLGAQTHGNFRLIVVDQNPDGRLEPILDEFESRFPIVHLRTEPGCSRARNVGLRHVEGGVVAFPDDDCWYPPDLLQRVSDFFAEYPELDGLGGRSIDAEGRPSGGRWDQRAGPIMRFNLWKRASTYTIFLRRVAVERTGLFDETLGPSAKWPSGEDLDYVLRSVAKGCVVYYEPEFGVYHPQTREGSERPDIGVGYQYGLGMGRVLRKHRLPSWFAAYQCARAFGGALVMIVRGRPAMARFHLAVGRGRIWGWLGR